MQSKYIHFVLVLLILTISVFLQATNAHALLIDNFYPAGTTQLGWSLIPVDALPGVPDAEYVGTQSFYTTNVFPNPSGDSAVMMVGNFTTNANFGVATYMGGDTTQTINYTDYDVEAWVYIVVDGSKRHQHILFARNAGNDNFAPQIFYNPSSSGGGPGFGTRGTAEGNTIHANPTFTQNQWVWMKLSVTSTIMNAYVDWTGDTVDDLGSAGKNLDVSAATAGGFGVEIVANDPGSGAAALINQPMFVDDVKVTFPSDLVIVPNPASIVANPNGAPVIITVIGGTTPYAWSISSGIGSLSTTAGASNTFTPGPTLGSGTITISDNAIGSAEIPVSLIALSAPLIPDVSIKPVGKKQVIDASLFE